LKIAVDARELVGESTGVGRYLRELLQRWLARPDARTREIVLYAQAPLPQVPAIAAEQVVLAGDGGTAWEQWTLRRAIRRRGADVLFAPAYTAPIGLRIPIVVTIHDISFERHPEWFPIPGRWRRRLLTRLSAQLAHRVVTVSEFSANEIESAFHIPRSRISVIRHGITRPQGSPGIERPPLILFVGSVFNRRHVSDLIAAMRYVRRGVSNARLAIVGANRTFPHEDLAAAAARAEVSGAVDFKEYVSDTELAALYARARVFVFVSEYEGFGLTPLEALAAGVPPVVSERAVSRETCGQAAVYVTPGDVAALAGAIVRLLTDDSERIRVLSHAEDVLGAYSWDRAAEQTLALVESAASGEKIRNEQSEIRRQE
jgi:glycosyltransferase involved in cell wall biosynthesis